METVDSNHVLSLPSREEHRHKFSKCQVEREVTRALDVNDKQLLPYLGLKAVKPQ